MRLAVEDLDEGGADDLALLLGIAHAREPAEEQLGRVGMDQRDVVMALEQRDDLVRLARAHQPGVDEDAGELVADGLVDQHGGDRRIHAARQAADHPALADLGADLSDLGLAEGVHVPFRLDAGDGDEVAQQHGAARRVRDLGMELHAVEAARLVADHRIGRAVRRRQRLEARRDGGDLVAMAHPHRLVARRVAETGQQRRGLLDMDVGAAELARMAGLDLAAELRAHRHLAVADAEHRHAELEHRLRRARRVAFGDAGGAAGEDDGLRRRRLQRGLGLLEGDDLAIDAGLAHAPRDELGHLRAEIDDEEGSCHGGI